MSPTADGADITTPVTIVTPDATLNCLGRALLLAELLADRTDVRIVGVRLGELIWEPARQSRIPLHTLAIRHAGDYPRAARFLRRHVAGRRVLVSKTRATSMGLALMAGVAPGGMLLDVDDWEVGFRLGAADGRDRKPGRHLRDTRELFAPHALNSYASDKVLDLVARRFPHVIVSNAWLASRFGGPVLPHVRDTDRLDPARVDVAEVKRALSMQGRPWVGFIGTVRRHKGVEVLLDALSRLEGADAPGLYIAGLDDHDAFAHSFAITARQRLGVERTRIMGQFDFTELPRWVAAADVICIPSLDEPAAWGQLPAKLFDAMAMARPVIASRVNDMTSALDGCGRVVAPGDPCALAHAIGELCGDAELRRELGDKARTSAIEHFSYTAGRKILLHAFSNVRPVGSGG